MGDRWIGARDPATAARIHPNDKQKLIRAAELIAIERKPLADLFVAPTDKLSGFSIVKIVLNPPRDELYSRIDSRCRAMFEHGLLEEVQSVLDAGFSPSSKALGAIGYREAVLHLSGALSREEAIALAQRNTRRYAKRQGTWFREEGGAGRLRGFGDSALTREEAFRLVSERKKSLEKS